jgi:predicted Zn-dependent protease
LPNHALDALLKAHQLAPQVSEIVLDTALALSQAGRLAEAARVLEPLAWAPHGGPAAEIAQRMLARARAGDKAGLLAEVADVRRQQGAQVAALRLR